MFYYLILTYARKCVDRIATQSISKIYDLWRLMVGDCDHAESYGWLLFGGNADASHMVYLIPGVYSMSKQETRQEVATVAVG